MRAATSCARLSAVPTRWTQEDEEFAMSTQDIVGKFIAEKEEQGRHTGLVESLLTVYRARFGEVTRAAATLSCCPCATPRASLNSPLTCGSSMSSGVPRASVVELLAALGRAMRE